MGAPKGNMNALGNKGGGRARAVDLNKLWALWNGEIKDEDLNMKVSANRGIYGATPFDDLAWRVLHNDPEAIKILRDKLFPRPVIRKVTKYLQQDKSKWSVQDIIEAHTPDLLKQK